MNLFIYWPVMESHEIRVFLIMSENNQIVVFMFEMLLKT